MAVRRPKPKPAAAAAQTVTLRLYCHGLGDCHLIGLPREAGGTFWMLIDCGIHSSSKGGTEAIRRVVADIAERTGGRIDVVVGTHEHWDHISGFVQARDLFAGIEIGEVWFGWTENPADPLARQLDRFKGEALAALSAATLRIAGDTRMGAAGEAIDTLLGFASGLAGEKSRDARETLRAMGRTVRHLEPGTVVPLPAAPGVRVHVLGPPRDMKLLRIEDSPDDTYRLGASGGPGGATLSALVNAMAVGDARLRVTDDALAPFDQIDGLCLTAMLGKTNVEDADTAFLSRHYAGPAACRFALEPRHAPTADQNWRRIDNDWLGIAADCALQMDSRTNNSSLVLAIELVESGRVLLFAADAQIGNWRSWAGVAFPPVAGAAVTGADLLARTIFYKVGHHGSRNATLSEGGLELMTDPGLIAFIPTDEAMAKKVRWKDIPATALLDRLRAKAGGRLIQSDAAWVQAEGAPPEVMPGGALQSVRVEPGLYVELEIG